MVSIAVGSLYLGVSYWRAGVEFENRLDEIRKAGHPVVLADLTQPNLDAQQDAGHYLRLASKDLAAIERELQSLADKYDESGSLSEAEWQQFEKTFQAYPEALPLLKRSVACAEYRSTIDFSHTTAECLQSLLDNSSLLRIAGRVLHRKILLLIARSQFDEAVEHCLMLHRLAVHSQREPFLTGYLVSSALRGLALSSLGQVLQAGPISNDVRKRIETQLAADDPLRAYQNALIAERPYGLACLKEMSPYLGTPAQVGYLRDMQNAIDSATLGYAESNKVLQDAADGSSNLFGHALMPAIQAAHESAVRVLALARSVRVLNAIQGSPAMAQSTSLDIKQIPVANEVKNDPFGKTPLVVMKSPKGWIVYSVGRDGKDNSGAVFNQQDIGTAPASLRVADESNQR